MQKHQQNELVNTYSNLSISDFPYATIKYILNVVHC